MKTNQQIILVLLFIIGFLTFVPVPIYQDDCGLLEIYPDCISNVKEEHKKIKPQLVIT